MSAFDPFGFGTYQLTGTDTPRSVRTAVEAGYRHVDTAQGYANEALVAQGLADADVEREAVFVATKLSTDHLGYEDAIDTAHESAARLGVDTIDLLYVHWPLNTYDVEETIPALNEVVADGLVERVGLSNFRIDQLEAARDRLDVPLFAHQVECHPLLQQDALRAHAADNDYHLVAYSPLARGAVTDVPELQDIAAAHDATPAQVSLAWLRAKDVAVIPKATSPGHITENIAARDLTLTDEDVATIDAIDREDRQVDFEDAPWHTGP
ncbi:MAG: aldo/keto reductase [Halobacteriaceae archaeon]